MAFTDLYPKRTWGAPSLLLAACITTAGCSSNDDASGFKAVEQTPQTPSTSSSSGGAAPTTPTTPAPTEEVVGSDGESVTVEISSDSTSVAAGGSTQLHLTFTDEAGNPVAVPGTWTAESPCSNSGQAEISPVEVSGARASFTYTANGCAGEDRITFTSSGEQLQEVSAIVDVDADKVAFLSFVSAEPTQIAVRGSGANEKSVVTFKVDGESSNAVADQLVNFSIAGSAGDVRVVQESAMTDANGLVSVTVLAGSTPNSVTVLAEHAATGAVATSRELVVATALPAANGFNLELSITNPNSWDRINEQATEIEAAVTDRFGNAVIDGTMVNFVSEEGGAVDTHCQTVNNTCIVTWKPGGRDPADGRARVLATVKGTEFFIDNNSNNIFDDDDTFTGEHDLGEPYSDNNDNGMYDIGEYFVDSNQNGVRDLGDGVWNGLNCMHSSLCPDADSDKHGFVHLSADVNIYMSSGDSPTICYYGGLPEDPSVPLAVTAGEIPKIQGLFLSDGNNGASNPGHVCPMGNPLPAGTTVSFAVSKGTLEGKTSWTTPDDATSPTGPYDLRYAAPDEAGSDFLTLTISVPGEKEWEKVWDIAIAPEVTE